MCSEENAREQEEGMLKVDGKARRDVKVSRMTFENRAQREKTGLSIVLTVRYPVSPFFRGVFRLARRRRFFARDCANVDDRRRPILRYATAKARKS